MSVVAKITLVGFLIVSAVFPAAGQTVTMSGYVKEASSGEPLVGAVVFTEDLSAGVSANEYDFSLDEDHEMLEAAGVFSRSKREQLTLPQLGKETLSGDLVRSLPALMGEADVIRVIQMMPGVQTPSEGSTGFSVRGGDALGFFLTCSSTSTSVVVDDPFRPYYLKATAGLSK